MAKENIILTGKMIFSEKKEGNNMQALLVIDLQKGIVLQKEFDETVNKIRWLIDHFKSKGRPVIFTKHIDDDPESNLYKECEGIEIIENLEEKADYVVQKHTPDSFLKTNLEKILTEEKVTELVICGFNTEYCCMFTAIVAADKGFNVCFIEDATGTVCDEETYEMPGLDINDFVGSVLNWSNIVTVKYLEEYQGEL